MATITVQRLCRGDVSLLSVWKNALELFVFNKSAMNSSHEFALVVLTDQANWVGYGSSLLPHVYPSIVLQLYEQPSAGN